MKEQRAEKKWNVNEEEMNEARLNETGNDWSAQELRSRDSSVTRVA
jgi:hypothetical protein